MVYFDTQGMPDIKKSESGKTYKRICKHCKTEIGFNKNICPDCGKSQDEI